MHKGPKIEKRGEKLSPLRVPKTLTFKMRPSAQPFLWKWVLFVWEWKIISTSRAVHLTSFWYRGPGSSEFTWLVPSRLKTSTTTSTRFSFTFTPSSGRPWTSVIRDLTKLRRRRQRHAKQQLHVHHTFLYISLPSLHNWNVKGPNFELTWERERQGDKFHFLYLKRTRSPLFSSNRTSLLSSNWVTWYKREKVVKDSKSIFQRRFHWRRRCRIVRSLFWGRRGSKEVSRAHLRLSVYWTTIGENSYKTKTPTTQEEKWKRFSISCFCFAHVRFC